MANKIKGEVALTHDGKSYTMVMDFNALAEFEEASGVENAIVFLENLTTMNARHMRSLFWAGLRQRHPDMTTELAGQILSSNMDKLGDAVGAAFPDAEPDAGNVPPARKARR